MQRRLEIDDLIATPEDPNFIAGIFNYCNRRCERCAFCARCRLYADEQRDNALHPDDDWKTRVERSFRQTRDMVRAWCEREHIEVGEFDSEPNPADIKAVNARMDETRADPLVSLAERYTQAAMTLSAALHRVGAGQSWTDGVRDSVETVTWYSMRVSSKTYRAVAGHSDREDDDDRDLLQSDWNGSAKVARLEIAESRTALNVLLDAGAAPADSPVRDLVRWLDELDTGLAARFPEAMAFVRPGFDTPDPLVEG